MGDRKKKIIIQLSHPFVIRVESKTLRPAITVSLQTGVVFFLNDLIRPPSEFSNSRRHNEDAIKTRTGFRCLRERGQLESSCYGQYYLKNKSKRMGTVIRVLWSLGEDSFNTGPQRDRSLCFLYLPSQHWGRLPRVHRRRASTGTKRRNHNSTLYSGSAKRAIFKDHMYFLSFCFD